MGFRLRAFVLHLLASFAFLSVLLLGLYLGWYRWPAWYLLGAETVAGVLILVDVGLGPLATLVVSNPIKPRREWTRDIGLIVFIQLSALSYGGYTLWHGRPLFYALSMGQIEVITAAAFSAEVVETARQRGLRFLPDWRAFPRWIWAPLPEDPEEADRIVAGAVMGGPDVTSMPQYFRPWDEGKAELPQFVVPVARLAELKPVGTADHRVQLAFLGRQEQDLGMLPVRGARRDGAWILDRQSGQPLIFLPVEIWQLSRQPAKH